MATVTLKGTIQSVTANEDKGNNFFVQKFTLNVAGYVDEFGEKKGKDQIFPIDNLNEKAINAKDLASAVGAKATCECFLNANEFEKDGKKQIALNLKLKSIQFANATA